jgi:hypothetical protein
VCVCAGVRVCVHVSGSVSACFPLSAGVSSRLCFLN